MNGELKPMQEKRRLGLGPKQIAWCRKKLTGFRHAEKIAAKIRREAEASRALKTK